MHLQNYRLPKTRLDKFLKNPALEHHSTSNMVNRHKHCCNLDDGTFTIFIDHSEQNSVGKSLC